MNTPLVVLAVILAIMTVVMTFAMVAKNKRQGPPQVNKHLPHQPKKKKDKTRHKK